MAQTNSFYELVTEALSHPVVGWDFSWLEGRITEDPTPWHFQDMVRQFARESADLLDLGTGGGEWLASIGDLPARTVATEGFPDNVVVARRHLEPLGVAVVAYRSPSDNISQRPAEPRLPFPTGSFHLITNRHESFVARELRRVLVPGGIFVTQQVGSHESLSEMLGAPIRDGGGPAWSLALATRQLSGAGMLIEIAAEARVTTRFRDVGALIWYLRAIPWAIPRFSVDAYQERLRALHEISQSSPLAVEEERFLVVARAPS